MDIVSGALAEQNLSQPGRGSSKPRPDAQGRPKVVLSRWAASLSLRLLDRRPFRLSPFSSWVHRRLKIHLLLAARNRAGRKIQTRWKRQELRSALPNVNGGSEKFDSIARISRPFEQPAYHELNDAN